MNQKKIIDMIFEELYSAKQKHEHWPSDIIHQVAIVQEECGESVRAALRLTYNEGGTKEDLIKEIVQTAATCIRLLEANCDDI